MSNEKEMDLTLVAFNVRTKQKKVPIMDPVLKKTPKGAVLVQGHDVDGGKLVTLISAAKADAVVAAGLAKWIEDAE